MRARPAILAVLVAAIVAAPTPARASHHLWTFSQAFSNASGTVQFIQLVVTEDGENLVNGVTITAGGHTFSFNKSLNSASTGTNKWILIGTTGFAATPGAPTPDFVLPDNFLPTSTATLSYGGGLDSWTYAALPTDGVNALHRSGGTVTMSPNTPENFNLQSGSVNLAAAVPALPAIGIAALVGALLVAGSGLLRRGRVKGA
jgi:hypothetical protein